MLEWLADFGVLEIERRGAFVPDRKSLESHSLRAVVWLPSWLTVSRVCVHTWESPTGEEGPVPDTRHVIGAILQAPEHCMKFPRF